MNIPADLAFFQNHWLLAREYVSQEVLTRAMATQIAIIVLAVLIAFRISHTFYNWSTRLQAQCATVPEFCQGLPFLTTINRTIRSFLAFIFVWIAFGTAEHFHWPRDGLYAAGIILLALTAVRLFTGEMQNRFWARVLAGAIWLWAALYISHLIEFWINLLSHIVFKLGQVEISLLHLTRAVPILLVLYWLSRNLSLIWRFCLTASSGLAPAVQIILSRLGTIFLFAASVAFVLYYLGIGLSVLALFSGALGLGLGFGLQKVFANLVSGFIILADKSVKPGDVIQMKDKYGWINFLGSRYCSVITRDGTEHLIPNENLITSEVINWSYSQNLVRLKVPVGVAYDSNLEQARDLMLEAARDTKRVLQDPKPSCYLLSFGDNAVNLELRAWINDPQNGLGSVRSDLLWGIWRRFKDHGIDMPYPQRDVHLKSIPEDLLRIRPTKV